MSSCVGWSYAGLLFVVPGRHGDQVIGRRRPSRCLLAGAVREGRLFALGGAVVTVEADVDRVERRLAAGELCVPGMRRGAGGLGAGQAAAGARPGRAGASCVRAGRGAPAAGSRMCCCR